ncbi:ATP-binding protein [Cellulomonas sp. KRMCY2]|uniref:ATP-binding protein n=1 Tax=Cellulomonas sp. KRMCY2 TaxID=1304865 RepID=UPI00350FBF02
MPGWDQAVSAIAAVTGPMPVFSSSTAARDLATGAYLAAGEPVVLLGDSGTGKTHLLIGLGVAACEQGHRVRYVTTAHLVNELAEAADNRTLSRVVARYARLDLLLLDELGYVQIDPRGAELLFHVIQVRSGTPISSQNLAVGMPASTRTTSRSSKGPGGPPHSSSAPGSRLRPHPAPESPGGGSSSGGSGDS